MFVLECRDTSDDNRIMEEFYFETEELANEAKDYLQDLFMTIDTYESVNYEMGVYEIKIEKDLSGVKECFGDEGKENSMYKLTLYDLYANELEEFYFESKELAEKAEKLFNDATKDKNDFAELEELHAEEDLSRVENYIRNWYAD